MSTRADLEAIKGVLSADLSDLEQFWGGENAVAPGTDQFLLLTLRDVKVGTPILNPEVAGGVFERAVRLLTIESYSHGGLGPAFDQVDRIKLTLRNRRVGSVEFGFPEAGQPFPATIKGKTFLKTSVFARFTSTAIYARPSQSASPAPPFVEPGFIASGFVEGSA
ncbi:MAG: hypothetical protein K0U98_11350 [Deltaproteobacteria bacterium]|nr:hypothetical protein [Deltaproteobacteria bacterium]